MTIAGMPGYKNNLTLIKKYGEPDESRQVIPGIVQPDDGFFDISTPIYEGDIIELSDPRGGTRTYIVGTVKIYDGGVLDHIECSWKKEASKQKVRDIYNVHGPVGAIGPNSSMVNQKGGDVNITGGQGGVNITAGPGAPINLRAGDGGDYYTFTNPSTDKGAFIQDIITTIQGGQDTPDVKAEAVAIVEKAKKEPVWDVAVRRIKSALSLVQNGANILAFLNEHGLLHLPPPAGT